MTMYTKEQFDDAASQWLVKHRATEDPATLSQILTRTRDNLERLGGNPAPSSFERSYLELVSEGVIKSFRGSLLEKPAAAPTISPDMIAFIESPRTTASQLRHRYSSDQMFRKQYDLYEQSKQKQQQLGVVSLTAEQYHSLLAQTIVVRYRREPGFKAAVDALIAKGLIALVLGLLHGGLV
jgi:hypothetical protein